MMTCRMKTVASCNAQLTDKMGVTHEENDLRPDLMVFSACTRLIASKLIRGASPNCWSRSNIAICGQWLHSYEHCY